MVVAIIDIIEAVPIYVWALLVIVIITGVYAIKEIKKAMRGRKLFDVRIQDTAEGEIVQDIGMIHERHYMLVDKGEAGLWIQFALPVSPGRDIKSVVEKVTEDLRKVRDITSYCYFITGAEGNMRPDKPGSLLRNTMYVSLKIPRRKDAESVLSHFLANIMSIPTMREALIPSPISAYTHFFYNRDPFGRPYIKPALITFEQPGFTIHDWAQIIMKRPELAREIGIPGLQEDIAAGWEGLGRPLEEREIAGPPIAGGVDEEAVEQMACPVHIGYSYDTNQKVYVDMGEEREAGVQVIGPTGSGKTVFSAVLSEQAVIKRKAAVVIIDPTPAPHHRGYVLKNDDFSKMSPSEQKVIKYLHTELGYDYEPTTIPTKILYVGQEGDDAPYDELFKINTNEMSLQALIAMIKTAAEPTEVQKVLMRIIVRILNETKKEYDLQDILDVITDLRENPKKYGAFFRKIVSLKEISGGRYTATLTALSIRVDNILDRLPGVFVKAGGTDFKKAIKNEQITLFNFSRKIQDDTELLDAIIEYILLKTYKVFEGHLERGIKCLIICEEAPRFMDSEKKPSAQAAKKITEMGRKWGVNCVFDVQSIKDMHKSISDNIKLLKVVFLPEERGWREVAEMFPLHKKEIFDVFARMKAEKWPGMAIVSGEGTNAKPWVLCRLVPRKTRHAGVETREEWLKIREEQIKEEEATAPEETPEALIKEIEELLKKT